MQLPATLKRTIALFLTLCLHLCLCVPHAIAQTSVQPESSVEFSGIVIDLGKGAETLPPEQRELSMATISVGYVIDPEQGGFAEVAFREDGSPFEETAFSMYLKSCRRVDMLSVWEKGANDAMLYLAAQFASLLRDDMWEEDIRYYQYLLLHPYTDQTWAYEEQEERYSFLYDTCYRLVLYGDPLTRAELQVSDPSGRLTCTLPLQTGYTQHALYEAEAQPDIFLLPAPAKMLSEQKPMLDAIAQLAVEDECYATSGEYALQQFGLLAACMHTHQPIADVLMLAEAFPALRQPATSEDGATLSWYAGRNGCQPLHMFCTFGEDGLSRVGFAIDPAALETQLAADDPALFLFGSDGTDAAEMDPALSASFPEAKEGQLPPYAPVVYLAIAEGPALP